ncbi:unnamed protein product [Bursaphelenchus xylophilus]|uniref:(pine wood nematode) hypothetical protein n=1 Tax=Bursaphelenchus xylophilus TaxID=6326 RepID=A0A1I7RIS8_BURXY|nr:unnamed protein product [Bursaphelenchus xylophilus]CAG9119066.1 unnamed protein product [Bursaphelenchus xylophilus]
MIDCGNGLVAGETMENEAIIGFTKRSTPWRSIAVMAGLEFGYGFQLALYLAPIWPYLQVIDKSASDRFYGLIVMANALGQLIACPLFGFWSRRVSTIVTPIYLCLTLTLLGNILFLTAAFLPDNAKFVILISRFVIGTGEAVLTLTRSYTAMASLPSDRSKAYGFSAAGLALGLLVGPAIQIAFSFLDYPGILLFSRLRLNLYTIAPLAVLLTTLIELFVFKFVFEETYPAIVKDKTTQEKIRCDKLAMVVMYFARFCQYFSFACAETLAATYIMSMYAKTHDETATLLSILNTIEGLLALAAYVFFIVVKVEKWISFRLLSIIGFLGLTILPFAGIPYPFYPTNIAIAATVNNVTSPGCSTALYSWCYDTKQVNFLVFTIALVVSIGAVFNMMTVVLSTMFSKIIGPKPQTCQQSFFQSTACFGRIVGPVLISSLFTRYGPAAAWLSQLALLFVVLIVLSSTYHRLVPAQFEPPYKKQTNARH